MAWRIRSLDLRRDRVVRVQPDDPFTLAGVEGVLAGRGEVVDPLEVENPGAAARLWPMCFKP